jgi:hypothetical protein
MNIEERLRCVNVRMRPIGQSKVRIGGPKQHIRFASFLQYCYLRKKKPDNPSPFIVARDHIIGGTYSATRKVDKACWFYEKPSGSHQSHMAFPDTIGDGCGRLQR